MAERSGEMWVGPEDDPRESVLSLGDERETLMGALRYQRQTLEMKCSGLDAKQMASRSVEPSTLSLLGLVRHLADYERSWFRRIMAEQDAPPLFHSPANPDGEFDDVKADRVLVEEAWQSWRAECAFADQFLAQVTDLGKTHARRGPPGAPDDQGKTSVREALVLIVQEYARHNGHADLLRERIDGRTGR